MVARTERSPGFGTPLAFPVSQWLREWSAWLYNQAPVTVAGPRRVCTGFRVAPFVLVQLYCSASLWSPAAARKGCFQLCFQLSAPVLIRLPLVLPDFLLAAEIPRVELSDS